MFYLIIQDLKSNRWANSKGWILNKT